MTQLRQGRAAEGMAAAEVFGAAVAMVAVFMAVAAAVSEEADSTAVASAVAAQLFAAAEFGWVEDVLFTPGHTSRVLSQDRASGVDGPMPSITGNLTAARG